MKRLDGVDIVKDLRKKQVRLIIIVLAFLSVVFIGFTIYWEIDYKKKFGYFSKVKAEVVDHAVVDNIEYDVLEYDVGENTYRHTTSYKSKNHIEDVITIYYDKNNPTGVIYKLDGKRISLPIISSLFMMTSIGVYVFYYYVFIKGSLSKSQSVEENKKSKKK